MKSKVVIRNRRRTRVVTRGGRVVSETRLPRKKPTKSARSLNKRRRRIGL